MLMRLAVMFGINMLWTRLSLLLAAAGVPMYVRVPLYAGCGVILLLLSLWIWQESILYVPSMPFQKPSDGPHGMRSPAEQGLRYEDVTLIASDGVRLHAWFMPAADPANAPTIIFAHENAGSMAARLPEFRQVVDGLRCNLLMYDYRGYGQSDNVAIDEAGLMRDAHAAWRWLVQQGDVDNTRIVLYGRSLGGAVTLQLARDLCEMETVPGAPLPCGVIVCNTFTSIEAMLSAKYRFLDWEFVRRRMLRMRWHSIEHVGRVRLPLLFIVGLRDEIVPSFHTAQLAKAAVASPSVEVREVAEGTHNDTWVKAGPAYLAWLRAFLEKTAPAAGVRELQAS